MSDILDDGLRQQLAAALLGWSGGRVGDDDCRDGLPDDSYTYEPEPLEPSTPPTATTEAPLGHKAGFMRLLMRYAEDEDDDHDGERKANAVVDDDIDADSVYGASDYEDPTERKPAGAVSARAGLTAPNKALPAIPSGRAAEPVAQEPSCRISRIPFTFDVEVPELMHDQPGLMSAAPSPSVSGPVTPAVASDVFRPLSTLPAPNLGLGPFSSQGPTEAEIEQRGRKMSTKSIMTEASATDALDMIREEESDVNTDGVSLLTPTERSFDGSAADLLRPRGPSSEYRPSTEYRRHHARPRSISSSESTTTSGGSSDWRRERKSSGIFSRMRSSRQSYRTETEFIERRTLTPYELSAPPLALDDVEPVEEVETIPDHPPVPPLPQAVAEAAPVRETGERPRMLSQIPWPMMAHSNPKRAQVFGVDLNDSIRVAPMKIRISHRGKSTSHRSFPLSVYKCCEFIRTSGEADANTFTAPGNAYNVSHLREAFSSAPSYGEGLDLAAANIGVQDAARIILVFLEELPKPLISSSVVKSWILLARQEGAIEPPCPRVETGLDFWTEALNRLPVASRNLTKHLLTFFAELLLSPSGAVPEVDARHLASAVSRAMFHHETPADNESPIGSTSGSSRRDRKRQKNSKNSVHATLALAFMIKKRGEYVGLMRRATAGTSKDDSMTKLFLPSTREIMEWKGTVH